MGFIGTGAITEAVVTGFCKRAPEMPFPIVLSPRTRERAERLQAAYPDRVTVAESLQQVLDQSEWVVLALLPQTAEAVLTELRFRPDHKVISFMADHAPSRIRAWIGETAVLTRMVPLTFHAYCNGPILLCPPQPEAEELFGRIGSVLPLTDAQQEAALFGITAGVAPLFSVMDTLVQWAVEQGVPETQAAAYVTQFFRAISEEAVRQTPEGIHTMATVSTPGGLNMAARDSIDKAGGFAAWRDALEQLKPRLFEAAPPKERQKS